MCTHMFVRLSVWLLLQVCVCARFACVCACMRTITTVDVAWVGITVEPPITDPSRSGQPP